MKRFTTALCVAFSAFVLASPLPAVAADASRGHTLYAVTYACTDCHGANPALVTFPASGTTADVLLTVIQDVPQMRGRYLATLGQNATDLADIAAYIASAVVQPRPDVDQQALTGSWYEASESGQGFEIEIYRDLIAPGTGLLQGAWFTFDQAPAGGADRQRWYTFSGHAVSGAANVPVTIFQNVGGNFNALPVTNAVAVGSGAVTFNSCTSGSLTYTFTDGSGRSGAIPMTRLTPNVGCTVGAATAANADFGLSGNWYDPATSGQGFVFEVNPLSPVVFFAWYTYSPTGQAAGAAGLRWLTGQGTFTPGTHTAPLTLYETTGGVFDAPTPMTQTSVPVGNATVTFASCASAQLAFNIGSGNLAGHAGMIALTRVGPVPVGCAVSADARRQ